MIAARTVRSPHAMAQSLARKAARLAEAQVADRLLARRDAPRRWRMARLLWPLFTAKD